MACLLKVLSDMLQSPQPLSHIHICPKPKVKLGPTENFYPAPPSSLETAILSDGDSSTGSIDSLYQVQDGALGGYSDGLSIPDLCESPN